MSSTIQLQWKDTAAIRQFHTGISLHSHTLHSRESLDFIYPVAAKVPILSAVIQHGERTHHERHGAALDLKRGWWTPPLGAHDAWLLERSQIESLGRHAIVSLTDHDNIDAPMSLQVLGECSGTPVSVEWTVPYGPTFFHLGIHNLPAEQARALWTRMDSYRLQPNEALLDELLAALDSIPQALIVFNHPMWDERGIGHAAHRALVMQFLTRYRNRMHAFELNGLRPWKENREAIALARTEQKPVISGGDRHAFEPNALINLTNTENFEEFVEEVRSGWSNVLVLRQYREPHSMRILHNMIDVLRPYEQHANGWTEWSDRVFYRWHDGTTKSLTESFGHRTPTAIRLFVGAMQLAAAPRIRRFIKSTFATPEEVTL